MSLSEQHAAALLEAAYPNLAAIAAHAGRDPRILRALAASARDPAPVASLVQPTLEAQWMVTLVTSAQAALGIVTGGTSFAITTPDGSPVMVSAASARNYLGATVRMRTGPARGRRTIITDIRQSGIATWVTVADQIGLLAGDQLVVEAAGTPAAQGQTSDGSGTIGAASTSQPVFAANPTRQYLLLQNPKAATESLWFNFGVAAVIGQPSIELPPASTFTMDARTFIDVRAVNIIAATEGDSFTAKEA